jgi:hypothetical protein
VVRRGQGGPVIAGSARAGKLFSHSIIVRERRRAV